MTTQATGVGRMRLAKFLVGALIAPLVLVTAAGQASAKNPGTSCKRRDLYKVAQVGTTYTRCMPSPGQSAHQSNARFSWQRINKRQFDYSNPVKNGTIKADGSSTVAPLMTVAAKYFENTTNRKVRVTVAISGTGGGFEKFCNGETDIQNASRAINNSEKAKCAGKGINYTEVIVANDGLAVVVNPRNPLTCLTTDQLKTMWKPATGKSGPGSASTWADVIPGNTLGALKLYGAGSDSGTFDSFNTFIHGSSSTSRTDYQATENDTVTVRGVQSSQAAVGYYGLSYAVENKGKNKAIAINKNGTCVAPTTATVQNGTYPLSRPLYVYIKNSSAVANGEIKQFLKFYFDNADAINRDALFVPLTKTQRQQGLGAVANIAG